MHIRSTDAGLARRTPKASHMATAREIACTYGDPDRIDDLERAILRHMEQHIISTAAVEREACAVLADSYERRAWDAQPSAQEAAVAAKHIAAAIRARSKTTT